MAENPESGGGDVLLRALAGKPTGLGMDELVQLLGKAASDTLKSALRSGKIVKWGRRGSERYGLPEPDTPAAPLPRAPTRRPAPHVRDALEWSFEHPDLFDSNLHARMSTELARVEPGQVTEASPFVLAHCIYLWSQGKLERARVLLSKFRRGSDGLGAYLAHALGNARAIPTGTVTYSDLSALDLFLAACYYPSTWVAASSLAEMPSWHYGTVRAALSEDDGHEWDSFKSGGLQPRIAELAFREVYAVLHGSSLALRDLNREHVRELAGEWRLRRDFPSADWSDGQHKYDVKSNIYFHSRRAHVGLRGFMINDLRGSNEVYAGFLFITADRERCSWLYVGEYRPSQFDVTDDRVLPFFFELPSTARYAGTLSESEIAFLSRPDAPPALRRHHMRSRGDEIPEGLFAQFLDQTSSIDAHLPLEYRWWHRATVIALGARPSIPSSHRFDGL